MAERMYNWENKSINFLNLFVKFLCCFQAAVAFLKLAALLVTVWQPCWGRDVSQERRKNVQTTVHADTFNHLLGSFWGKNEYLLNKKERDNISWRERLLNGAEVWELRVPISEHKIERRREINYMWVGNSNSWFDYKDGESGLVFFPRNCIEPTFLLEEIAIPLRYMPDCNLAFLLWERDLHFLSICKYYSCLQGCNVLAAGLFLWLNYFL